MSFIKILEKYRKISFSQKDKGDRFERLIQAYLLTDPIYANKFKKVWLWNEFPGRNDLGGSDTGIDLVALTNEADYWAIQCKCYQESSTIDKPSVDSFLSTSSRGFKGEDLKTTKFSNRLWISTTNKWGPNATEAIKNQQPPVTRLGLHDLAEAAVDWEKLEAGVHGEKSRINTRNLKDHQKKAMNLTNVHFKDNDRGKLIMACGTGKTFTSLRIAEKETDGKGFVLFLVPSIALLGQTLREWSTFAEEPINAICICSDPEISKSRSKNEDVDSFSVVDLALPASTNVHDILVQFSGIKNENKPGMTVVFSTYQSIEVISKAQQNLDTVYGDDAIFDLIICDEAHRTTGVSLVNEDESAFTKVHNNDFLKAKKRLYMTATPRLYDDNTKSKAAQNDAVLCSMDDIKLYGEEIYRIGFGEAVDLGLLTDYKVLILTLSDKDIPPAVQKMIADEESEINTDDASKLIGCINSLSKQILGDEGIIKDSDPEPMRRAVAFCSNIAASKKITATFNTATEAYIDSLPEEKKEKMVSVSSDHIDGSMSAPQRDELLSWLKGDIAENQCKVLTNVRCLSEGVDVPSLDAVLFLSARNSQVDVVQSVGRVMRLAPGKKYGYIIIPVVVPSDVEADKALDDNERFKVVWTVLNALRAHDDRFNATVNKIELNKNRPDQILVGRPDFSWDEDGNFNPDDSYTDKHNKDFSSQLALQFEQLQHVVFGRMVQKVGDRRFWEQWAKNVAEIAERNVQRIKGLIRDNGKHAEAFQKFIEGLQKNINPGIDEKQAIDMLSQHIITKPVFEALFEGYSFVKNNAISVSMQKMLDLLEDENFEKDAESLDKFYESVRMRAAGIDNAEGKQRIIIELYDKFFKTAFPKMVEQLGIVYTPVEVVDFIIHSVNDVLKQEFGRTVSDENVHILDPFTGTGTFMTRLLQSGLIEEKDLERKYRHELHANELVLLAYYIASINIENAFHDATPDPDDGIGKEKYIPFDGIVLTDTFQLGESTNGEKMFSEMFPQNSERVEKQMKAPLRVIIGNPPYSVGQKNANDDAQNQKYPILDSKVAMTYAKFSSATSVKAIYDPYIKAFRWATDRLDENGGIIGFITNSGWLEKGGADGIRKCFEKDFSSIYILNLRGAIKGKNGEAAKREGQNVFDIMTGVAIVILVKNPLKINAKANIFYRDIGNYLDRKTKLKILRNEMTILNSLSSFESIKPNEESDWINLRSDKFSTFIPVASEKKFESKTQSFFITHSLGTASARDSWVWNYSTNKLRNNMESMILFYNQQRQLFVENSSTKLDFNSFCSNDSSKISWNDSLRLLCSKNQKLDYQSKFEMVGFYRPFVKSNLYFDRNFIQRPYQQPKLYPKLGYTNLNICVSGLNSRQDNTSVFMTNKITDLNLLDSGTQCFPLYYYEENNQSQKGLFDSGDESEYIRRDGISDFILERAIKQFGKNVSKEDIFYYVYGFLHSPEYRELFANDLKKMLPRLPLVEDVRDFWAFSKAGRKLAELHLNYEAVPAYDGVIVSPFGGGLKGEDNSVFRVEKMRFPKKDQKDTIIYNSKITISNIPAEAYDYVVNGKSAIEWIMERYAVTTHKDSGITNDPNDWADEVGNPRYILDLLLSIINVSVQTVEIVKGLPRVKFD
jgi:predicted helicase